MDALWWAFLDYTQQGGWVMVPLGLCSLAMWTLIIERLHTFRGLGGGDIEIRDAVRAVQGECLELHCWGLRAQLVRCFLLERTGDPTLDPEILRACAALLRPTLCRFLATILVLASIAPLLGLLGTVIGMIRTFDVIALFGTSNAKALAGGISVALVTTQTGLLIAIPGLWLNATLERRSSRLEMRLTEVTSVLMRHVGRVKAERDGRER